MHDRNSTRAALLALPLLLAPACGGVIADDGGPDRAGDLLRAAVAGTPALSTRAQRVADLLDADKREAAASLLDAWLSAAPDDAGLQLQRLRLDLRTQDCIAYTTAGDPTQALLHRARTAAQLDEDLRARVADELLWHVHTGLLQRASSGATLLALAEHAYVARPEARLGFGEDNALLLAPEDAATYRAALAGLPFGALALRAEFGTLFVGGSWMRLIEGAAALDPGARQRWSQAFAEVPQAFVRNGMYLSALLALDAEARLGAAWHDARERTVRTLDAARSLAANEPLQLHRLAVALLTWAEGREAEFSELFVLGDERVKRLLTAFEDGLPTRTNAGLRSALGL